MTNFIPKPHPLCSPRPNAQLKRKTRHRLEDFLVNKLGIDPKVDDVWERARGTTSRMKLLFESSEASNPSTPIAVYAHFNKYGQISEMVLRQLELIREQGFNIHFISMSKIKNAFDKQRLFKTVTSAFVRKSFGRDFGAWYDFLKIYKSNIENTSEILLLNDSILGPIFPLDSLFDAMRAGPVGLYGLTDSPDRIPHLQSYFLFCRGTETLAAVFKFFDRLKLSFSKSATIRRGELGFTNHMVAMKVPIWTMYPYEAIEAEITSDISLAEPLIASYPSLHNAAFERLLKYGNEASSRYILMELRFNLMEKALNPTHYYWRTLIEKFQFPFIKVELMSLNPCRQINLTEWKELVASDAPVGVKHILSHLRNDKQ